MTLRENAWLRAADDLCDRFAIEGEFAPAAQCKEGLPRDPWYRWVCELGVREGQHMREHPQRGGAFVLPGAAA